MSTICPCPYRINSQRLNNQQQRKLIKERGRRLEKLEEALVMQWNNEEFQGNKCFGHIFEVSIHWASTTKKHSLEFSTYEAALQWLCPPYIRCDMFYLVGFPKRDCAATQIFLEQIRHCWRNGILNVYMQNEGEKKNVSTVEKNWLISDTLAFKTTISQCAELCIWMRIIPPGFPHLDLLDVHIVDLPLETFESNFNKLMDWLESPRIGSIASIFNVDGAFSTIRARTLQILAWKSTLSKLEPIFDAIKRRFIHSKLPPALPMLIKFTNMILPDTIESSNDSIFSEFNPGTKEHLRCFNGQQALCIMREFIIKNERKIK